MDIIIMVVVVLVSCRKEGKGREGLVVHLG